MNCKVDRSTNPFIQSIGLLDRVWEVLFTPTILQHIRKSIRLTATKGKQTMTKKGERSHRVRDFVLYILIGVAVASSAILIGWSQAKTGHPSNSSLKWGAHAVTILLVLWWAVRTYKIRGYKKRIR
jgi:hypothetical protein